MSTFRNALQYLPKRALAISATVAAVVVVPATLMAWGPDRALYTIENPAKEVTFNSITNNPNVGDERNFVGIRESGATGTWSDNMTVQEGKEYVVRMYVHNNAADNLNLVAKDVTAKFSLPTTTGKSIQVGGFLHSSNANPVEVYDSALFSSDRDFNLAYVSGSLKYYNNAFGSTGTAINESVFTATGAKLGYDKLDGNIPGCFQYAGYLTFIVKPQLAPVGASYKLTKQVRKLADKTYVESVAANAGDKLAYRVQFENTSTANLDNVILKDTMPAGVTFVPGSVQILSGNNPKGAYVKDGNNLFTTGINIGSYGAGTNAYIAYEATVDAADKLPCGNKKLVNTVSAQPAGQGAISDTAEVATSKTCVTPTTTPTTPAPTTPTQLPKTGIGDAIAAVLGAGSLVASTAYYIISRRNLVG